MSGKVLLIGSATDTRTTLAQRLCDALFDVCEQGFDYMGDLHLFDCVVVVVQRIGDIDVLGADFKNPGLPCLAVLDRGFDGSPSAVLGSLARDVLPSPLLRTEFLARVRGLIRRHTAHRELDRRANLNRAIGFNDPAQGFVAQSPVHVVTSGAILPTFFKSNGFQNGNFRFVHQSLDQLRSKLTRQPISVVVLCYDKNSATLMTNLVLDLRAHPNSRYAAILCWCDCDSRTNAAQLLDMGADDLFDWDSKPDEILYRIDLHHQSQKINDALRQSNQLGLSAAITDPLTGLFNRRYAMGHLDDVCSMAQSKGSSVAALMIDIDHFKQFNDSHGHFVGDQVLVAVANTLQSTVRASDMVARIGGEEFVVILPDLKARAAQNLAQRLCDRVRKIPIDGTARGITISIGISLMDYGAPIFTYGTTERDLLIWADRALYQAKDNGRDQVSYYRA